MQWVISPSIEGFRIGAVRTATFWLAATFWLVSCQSDSKLVAGSIAAPGFVQVGGGAMQSGFSTGSMRGSRTLPAYQITRHPVTWGEYDACVAAGACATPDATE